MPARDAGPTPGAPDQGRVTPLADEGPAATGPATTGSTTAPQVSGAHEPSRTSPEETADEPRASGTAPSAGLPVDGQRLGAATGQLTDLPPLPEPPGRTAPGGEATTDAAGAPHAGPAARALDGLVLPRPPRDGPASAGTAPDAAPVADGDPDSASPSDVAPSGAAAEPDATGGADASASPSVGLATADLPVDLPVPGDGEPTAGEDDRHPPANPAARTHDADAEPAKPPSPGSDDPAADPTVDLRSAAATSDTVRLAPTAGTPVAAQAGTRPWVRAYPPGVPETYRYPLVPLTRFLDDAAQDFPDTTGLSFLGTETSYRQLSEQVDRLGSALTDLELSVGDRVGIALPWSPQLVLALHACWRRGFDPVVLDPDAPGHVLAGAVGLSAPRVLILLDTLYPALTAHAEQLSSVRHVVATNLLDALPSLRARVQSVRMKVPTVEIPASEGVLALRTLLERAAPTATQVDVDVESAPAMTVVRDGAVTAFTHHQLLVGAFQARLWIPDVQAGREVVAVAGDPTDPYGMAAGMLMAVLSAGTVLLPEPRPGGLARTIDAGRPTILVTGVEEVRKVLAPSSRKQDLTSLRVSLVAGAPADPAVRATMEQRTGGRLRTAVTTPRIAGIAVAEPVYADPRGTGAGLALPDTDLRVVPGDGPAAGLAVGPVEVSGPQVPGGWQPLGLVGWLDDTGFLTVVGDAASTVVHADGVSDPAVIAAAVRRSPGVVDASVRTEFTDGALRLVVDATVADDGVTPAHLLAGLAERAPAQAPPSRWDITVAAPTPAAVASEPAQPETPQPEAGQAAVTQTDADQPDGPRRDDTEPLGGQTVRLDLSDGAGAPLGELPDAASEDAASDDATPDDAGTDDAVHEDAAPDDPARGGGT
ncbi:AMP-binding protein [Euzebya sp.]|uniref:AMP-binding protein n=1 Tax=Euzebya sp. TaxID=1971409 RepID=UPI0035175EC9